MKRVNQMNIYRLGRISRLGDLEVGSVLPYEQFFAETFSIAMQLESFVENDEYKKGLPRAVEKAALLRGKILAIYNVRIVDDNDIHELHLRTLQFETSLDDELQRLHAYTVDPVGAYSFDRLIGTADTVFPEEQRNGPIPEQVLTDFRSAGRCLAFDLPTACGFHACRATDAMLRAYCAHFNAQPKTNARDWGKYIGALRDVLKDTNAVKKPNVRTIELLDSIRATDRNPLIHPEDNLDSKTALQLFDLCKNAVSLMVTDVNDSP